MGAAQIGIAGQLTNRVSRPEVFVRDAWMPQQLAEALKFNPKSHLGRAIKDILRYLPAEAAEAAAELINRACSAVIIESRLLIVVQRGRLSLENYLDRRAIEDYGVVGEKVVTTAGVNFIVDGFQNTTEIDLFKFHGLGTGSGAEATSDTALGTELTTEYTGNVRVTGSQTEGASANIYRSVGANLLDGTPGAALREHGLFSASSAGTLLDRTVYGAITLSSGDTLTSTYDLTCAPGS